MEITITCPKCGAEMPITLAEMGDGQEHHCPSCGTVIRFRTKSGTSLDAAALEHAVEMAEHAGATVKVRVNQTKRRVASVARAAAAAAPADASVAGGAPISLSMRRGQRERRRSPMWSYPLVFGLLVTGMGLALWRGFHPAPPLPELGRAEGVVVQAGRPTSRSSYTLVLATAAQQAISVRDRAGCRQIAPAEAFAPGDTLQVWYSAGDQVLYQLQWRGQMRCSYDVLAAAQARRVANARTVGRGMALAGVLLLALAAIGAGRWFGEDRFDMGAQAA